METLEVTPVLVGQRIRQARIMAQLSMRELAARVGVSHTAISKYEQGSSSPGASVLTSLARALGVRTEYFFRQHQVEMEAPAYRKRSGFSVRKRAAVEAGVKSFLELYLFVEGLFPPEREVRFDVRPQQVNRIGDAELAAESLRDTWNLGSGPIGDLTGLLEDHGVKVLTLTPRPGLDGFSCWANQSTPVVVCPSGSPGDRQRFSLAHELGHLLLQVQGEIEAEKAAHRFAGALLAPREAVHRELGRSRSRLALEELMLLKQEYGMSMQAWARRARDLGIISEPTFTRTCRLFSAQGWRTQEPGEELPEERPRRFLLLVYQAMAEGLLTPSTAADLLGEPASERPRFSEALLSAAAEFIATEYEFNRELTVFTDTNTEDIQPHDDGDYPSR